MTTRELFFSITHGRLPLLYGRDTLYVCESDVEALRHIGADYLMNLMVITDPMLRSGEMRLVSR